jgi:hypothetical protein
MGNETADVGLPVGAHVARCQLVIAGLASLVDAPRDV